MSFADLVQCVVWIVKQLQLSERLQDIEFISTGECLHFFVDLISSGVFLLANPQVLSSDMVLWLLRQSGLTQSCVTFDKVFDLCQKYRSLAGEKEDLWDSTGLPLVLTKVVQTLKAMEQTTPLPSQRLSEGRPFAFLALHMPSAIFPFSYAVPSLLSGLYSSKGLLCVRSIHSEILRIFKYCHIAEYVFQEANSIKCKKPNYLLTYRAFLKLTQDVGILHAMIPLKLFKRAFEYLFENSTFEKFYISIGDILEVIFVLSQISFNTNITDSHIETALYFKADGDDKSLLCSTDSLECFRTFILLYDESITMMLEGSDVRQSYLSEPSLQFTSSFFHASDLNVLRQRPFWSDASTIASDVSVPLYQGPSPVDLLIIIMHYPLNSARFNPWNVHRIFSRHIRLNSFSNNQMNDSSVVFELLQDVMREYHLDREIFISYFARLYVGKQHLPHLLRREVKESLRSSEVSSR